MGWRRSRPGLEAIHDDIMCDGPECESVYVERGTRQATVLASRARGWHSYDGSSMTGAWMTVHLCPRCAGNAKRLAAPEVLENQQTIF